MLSVCISEISDNLCSNVKKYGDCIYYYNGNEFVKRNIKTRKCKIKSLLFNDFPREIEICDDVIYVTRFDDIIAFNINNMTKIEYNGDGKELKNIVVCKDLIFAKNTHFIYRWNKLGGTLSITDIDADIEKFLIYDDIIYCIVVKDIKWSVKRLNLDCSYIDNVIEPKSISHIIVNDEKIYVCNKLGTGSMVDIIDTKLKNIESINLVSRNPSVYFSAFTLYNELIYSSSYWSILNIHTIKGQLLKTAFYESRIDELTVQDDLLIATFADRSIRIYSAYYPHHRNILGLKQKVNLLLELSFSSMWNPKRSRISY